MNQRGKGGGMLFFSSYGMLVKSHFDFAGSPGTPAAPQPNQVLVGTVQSGDWKLLEYFEDNHLELYNLKDDLGEKNNLAEKMPDKAKELHAMMIAWRKDVGAKMPTANPGVRSDQ